MINNAPFNLQIKDSRLHFRYNLNSVRTEERDIWLTAIAIDDGQWHTVRVSRYGSAATLELDGGEGRRFNETFSFKGHQWLLVDKQEGVFAGGKAEYTGVRTFEVYADYQKGTLLMVQIGEKSRFLIVDHNRLLILNYLYALLT